MRSAGGTDVVARRGVRWGATFGLLVPLAAVATGARDDGWFDGVDHDVVDAAHSLVVDHPVVADVAEPVSFLGGAPWLVPFIALVALVLAVRRYRRHALFLVATTATGALANDVIKHLAGRDRPAFPDPVSFADGFSFPSGHAMGATICYGALVLVGAAWLAPRWRRVALVAVAGLILAIGATRVVLGVHYPSDVVAGHLAGLVWLAGAVAVWQRVVGPDAPLAAGADAGVTPHPAPS